MTSVQAKNMYTDLSKNNNTELFVFITLFSTRNELTALCTFTQHLSTTILKKKKKMNTHASAHFQAYTLLQKQYS